MKQPVAKIILITIVIAVIAIGGYLIFSKKLALTKNSNQTSTTGKISSSDAGFTAEITGARTAAISAPGIFYCIPSTVRSSPGMVAPSLLVLADNQGIRENGITFSIPIGKPSGTYKLSTNPSPFPDTVEFQVRAELGSTIDYFNKNTKGTLTIDSIPEGTQNGAKSPLKGSFDFDTSNSKGEQVKIKGHFDFPAPQDNSKYCQ
jgi:hypothetical protein